jgi:hypothetical protein
MQRKGAAAPVAAPQEKGKPAAAAAQGQSAGAQQRVGA